MPEQLLKNFSVEIQQKLYEKKTPKGDLAVYQTTPFGMLLTIDDKVILSEQDSFFYHEMMTHPALFTHAQPAKVAIIGSRFGILQEVLKHDSVQEIVCIDTLPQLHEAIQQYFSAHTEPTDARVHHVAQNFKEWIASTEADTYDVIIQTDQPSDFLEENFKHYFRLLRPDGIFIQPCFTSLMQLHLLKPIYKNLQQAGFSDWQVLNFPQPSYASGWRTIMMATKRSMFRQVREKEIFNRSFTTRYYNFDIHKAALVLPEFAREALEDK